MGGENELPNSATRAAIASTHCAIIIIGFAESKTGEAGTDIRAAYIQE
jgi:hypothetical protein